MIDPGVIQAVARRYLAVARSTLEMDVAWLSEHPGAEHLHVRACAERGSEVIGTLCASARARRYLSDRATAEAERISRAITDRLARGGEGYDPPVPAAHGS